MLRALDRNTSTMVPLYKEGLALLGDIRDQLKHLANTKFENCYMKFQIDNLVTEKPVATMMGDAFNILNYDFKGDQNDYDKLFQQ